MVNNPARKKGAGGIRVMIVDDHEVVRQGLRNMLDRVKGVVVVGEAGDGEEAIRQMQVLTPDVVLMDVKMPKLDGIQAMKRMRKLGMETPVVLLTAFDNEEYVFEGLRAGARGYLLKGAHRDELGRAIRRVYEGGSQLDPAITNPLISRLGRDLASSLTDRELEVLRLIGSGAGNKEIADNLSLSINTIKSHVEKLYGKLGARSRTQAVRAARERGLFNP